MTDEQKQNLNKLADYLDSGELLAGFDMWSFDDCCSAACAIGHGPHAGIPKNYKEGWIMYSERVFGLLHASDKWDYCFSSSWTRIDNTPEGAAKRIRKVLEGGKIKLPWGE